MEKTLIIFKPDCVQKKLVGTVLDRFERAGFTIVACKMMRLTPALLAEHYAHIADKPYYPPLVEFMLSSPVVVMALQGEDAVARVRAMLGPTDSRKAEKGTIRGDFGTDGRVNILHASDSPDNGLAEIARFFKPEEVLA
ncbi:MAG TPA: nucleoside-diphosphate kinase [Opitutaceae bacterium]|jgi:nucleoside-diphosphate kinase|nr:nucleoside-diphosphate kinase [Opitutaceae bacterium]